MRDKPSATQGTTLALRIKRLVDILVSLILTILLVPIALAVALIIRITLGSPVIFRQERLGQYGRPFVLLKFRTMANARDSEGELLPEAERLTRAGRLIRSLSLDELPELVNVLKGDMSLVGPRPLMPYYRGLYTEEQWRRHEMPAGIAGLVVVKGRNALSWEEKFELDLWYVDNWSLWLDTKLMAQTVWMVFKREGISAQDHVTMPRFTGPSDGS